MYVCITKAWPGRTEGSINMINRCWSKTSAVTKWDIPGIGVHAYISILAFANAAVILWIIHIVDLLAKCSTYMGAKPDLRIHIWGI